MPGREEKYAECKETLSEYFCKQSGVLSYTNYSFSLACFIYKLYYEIVREQITEVFFLAREGEFLKRLFDGFLEIAHAGEQVSSEYLYVSRQSTYAASLTEEIDNEEFSRLFRQFPAMSVHAFLKNLSFSDNEIELVSNEFPQGIDLVIDGFGESNVYIQLRSNDIFRKIYKQRISKQKQLLTEYLTSKGMYNNKKVAIVDVGWRGSIQDNIYLSNPSINTIYGYYLGLVGDVWTEKNNRKKGLLFADYPCKTRFYNIFNFDSHFFERVLTASHPSTRGYGYHEGQIVPEFNEFGEEEKNYILIKELQDRIYDRVLGILGYYAQNKMTFDEVNEVTAAFHIRALTEVNAQNMKFQNQLLVNQEENFGAQTSNKAILAKNYSMQGILKRVKKIVYITQEPVLVVHVLWHKKLFSLSALIFRWQKRKLNAIMELEL